MSDSSQDSTTEYSNDSRDVVPSNGAEVTRVVAAPLHREQEAIQRLDDQLAARLAWELWHRRKRRRLRVSAILFVLTFLSTTLVGADYWPLDILPGFFSDEARVQILTHLTRIWPTEPGQTLTISDRFWGSVRLGCTYSCPLMLILLCHEMGHYLQAVRYRVPASFPYFIPLPLPPLGTMGAVILQGRGGRQSQDDVRHCGDRAHRRAGRHHSNPVVRRVEFGICAGLTSSWFRVWPAAHRALDH